MNGPTDTTLSRQDIKRDFHTVVDLGSGCGHIVKHLSKDNMKKLIMCDMSGRVVLAVEHQAIIILT